MYASLGLGPVAALPASVPPSPLASWSSGSGWSCVRQERKHSGGVRASVRGASVWQVSEAAGFGVSSLGKASSAFPPPLLETLMVLRQTPPLPCLHVPPPPRPAPPLRPPVGPWLCKSSILTQRVGVATPVALRTFPGSW